MKIRLILTLILFSILSCRTGDDTLARKEEFKSILTDYYNALGQKDLQKLNALTTENFILFDEGSVYSNESAVKAISKNKPFTVTFTFDSLNAHIDKKNASVYYFREADFTLADTIKMHAKFLESATFNKEGNKWKLRFLHSTYRR
jgi:ketosteroid isomerase-like protein